jgi:uncharacterized protein YxjI
MELFFKKIKLTVLDKYEVTDEKGNLVYDIRGQLISSGDHFRINDASGREVASVHKKKLSIRDKYVINTAAGVSTDVFRIDTIRKMPEYRAKQIGWTLKGDFSRKSLRITEGLHTIAEIRPKLRSFKENLRIDVKKEGHELLAVALLLTGEADMAAKPENAETK